MLEAVEDDLCLLGVPEVMHCMLLCLLEVSEVMHCVPLCLLEVLKVLETLEVM
jgi:hypothetical protein